MNKFINQAGDTHTTVLKPLVDSGINKGTSHLCCARPHACTGCFLSHGPRWSFSRVALPKSATRPSTSLTAPPGSIRHFQQLEKQVERETERGKKPRNKQNTTSHCCSKKQQVSRGERKRVQVVIRDRAFESLERVAAFEKRTPCSPLTRHQLALSSMLQDELNNKNMSASFQSVLQPFLKLFPSWQQPRLWNDNFEQSFFPPCEINTLAEKSWYKRATWPNTK